MIVFHVISFVLKHTDFLNHITPDNKINPALIFNPLKENDYIHSSVTNIDDVCTRKDIAYFILEIIVYLKNDPALKDKYTNHYKENKILSPVPDVLVNDYFFNAVLMLVENEIMELPNGIHFFPENTMSGIEFNELLTKVKEPWI